jgi:hypothetical protein
MLDIILESFIMIFWELSRTKKYRRRNRVKTIVPELR